MGPGSQGQGRVIGMRVHFMIGVGSLLGLLILGSLSSPGVALARGAALRQDGEKPGLVIENNRELPETYPQARYELRFRAQGGVSTLHWRLEKEKGSLPPGLKLEDDGLLHGSPERTGEFRFAVSVHDAGQAVQKAFVLRVHSALILDWKTVAHVNGNRIEGSAVITNTTQDDVDLTFIVLAVPGNGRAVAIGYQHFLLRRGTVSLELPFGETLSRGGYVVHVDAVGEVAGKKVIYRERMQTPGMLQVAVGP